MTTPFDPTDSKMALGLFAAASSVDLGSLDASQAVDLMLRFYTDTRAQGIEIDADGDMLLHEWGVVDWGDGPSFEFSLVRQFISDVDGMSQLHLELHFAPSEISAALDEGSLWCGSPGDIQAFREDIQSGDAFQVLANAEPDRIEVYWEAV